MHNINNNSLSNMICVYYFVRQRINQQDTCVMLRFPSDFLDHFQQMAFVDENWYLFVYIVYSMGRFLVNTVKVLI